MTKGLNKKREEFIRQLNKCKLFSDQEIKLIIKEEDKEANSSIVNPFVYDFSLLQIRYSQRFGLVDIN